MRSHNQFGKQDGSCNPGNWQQSTSQLLPASEKNAGRRFALMELRHLSFSDSPLVVVVWADGCGGDPLMNWVLGAVQAVACDSCTDLL